MMMMMTMMTMTMTMPAHAIGILLRFQKTQPRSLLENCCEHEYEYEYEKDIHLSIFLTRRVVQVVLL
jgi:hypothetical protein